MHEDELQLAGGELGRRFVAHQVSAPRMSTSEQPKSIEWVGGLDGYVALIDQTLLPEKLEVIACREVNDIWDAIWRLRIRGAPAIGIAAAMGVVLGVRAYREPHRQGFFTLLQQVCDHLAGARPTAVNLCWALQRMQRRAERMQRA